MQFPTSLRRLLAGTIATLALAVAPAAAQASIQLGVYTPGAPAEAKALSEYATMVGRQPDIVMWYRDFGQPLMYSNEVKNLGATGQTPLVTWEPYEQSLSQISSGAYDKYLQESAAIAKSWGKPLMIRFAHEMNGNWYPWAEGVNGNGAGDFVAAWRHVVGVFRSAKVSNVSWTWAANVPYAGSTPLSALYPGDSYVTRVGLDGYNWSTLQSWSTWQSFADVFGPGLAELRALTAKPEYISETASPEVGGDKAAWISDMWSTLAAHPEVRGITWFDYDKETDWRIDSSDTALAAFATGMRTFS